MNIQEYIWHEIKPRPEVAREREVEIKLLMETSLQWEAVLTWVPHDFHNSIQNYWDGSLQQTVSCYFLIHHNVSFIDVPSQHSITCTLANFFYMNVNTVCEWTVLCRYMLKSLGLWKTKYEDPVLFKEKEQKFHLDREVESVGQHQVDKEDTLTASAAASAGKDISALKRGGSRLSYSAPGLGISGSSSQLARGSGLRRRSSAGSVSEQVRYGSLCHMYTE
jgi:hypothetical protein